ncbi:MAG: HAD family hydrolase [Chloroflexi bacterium]|nr:HAD family hydrolase [Chloroflexota bacterium]
MKTNSSFDLVIFDCDGVLVNSEPLANQVFVELLAEHGHRVNAHEYQREFSGAAINERLAVTSHKLKWTPPENFYSVFNERLSDLTERELTPVSGIHDLIRSITAPICVASNGSREEILLRLKIARLTEFFDGAIFSGLEVAHPKPAPDVFLEAARSFNATPARCVVIEDSIPGVTAAVRAGMKVFGHAAYTPSKSLLAAGAIPFDNMMELQSILNRNN